MIARSITSAPRSPAAAQALYYLISGSWPLVAYRSFEMVTGRKREPWLVKMVGLLTIVAGGVLASDPSGSARQTRALGVGSALAYAAVDIWYAGLRRRISLVYLLDALVELGFVAAWTRPRAGPSLRAGPER